MGGNGGSRHQAQEGVRPKGCCNEHAVGQGMNGAARQQGGAALSSHMGIVPKGVGMAVMLMMVVVPKERETLQCKKTNQTSKHGGCNGMHICATQVKALGQQVQQRSAHEHAGREAHHPIHHRRETAKRHHSRQQNAQAGGRQ
ncbi:MAG: hypothetical protein ACO3TO_05540 [Burkholderiaceae bacterium]